MALHVNLDTTGKGIEVDEHQDDEFEDEVLRSKDSSEVMVAASLSDDRGVQCC